MNPPDGNAQGPIPEPGGDGSETLGKPANADMDPRPALHPNATVTAPLMMVSPMNESPTGHELAGALQDIGRALSEMLTLQKEQLEISRRAEQRVFEQQQSQQAEWQKWLDEYRHLRGRCKGVEETMRAALVNMITEMVDHIQDNADAIRESEFAQRELTEKYGSTVYQLWNLSGILKRLSAVDQNNGSKTPNR